MLSPTITHTSPSRSGKRDGSSARAAGAASSSANAPSRANLDRFRMTIPPRTRCEEQVQWPDCPAPAGAGQFLRDQKKRGDGGRFTPRKTFPPFQVGGHLAPTQRRSRQPSPPPPPHY